MIAHCNFYIRFALFLGCALAAAARAETGAPIADFIALNYHDVISERAYAAPDARYAVTAKNLEAQFAWLKNNRYTVIDIQTLLDARNGKQTLPDKAVLLSFDDGYLSFYTEVLPLLKTYRYPATLAVVGSWLESRHAPNQRALMSAGQLREVVKSGLVEIASHGYDLHRGVIVNAHGDYQSAATARAFLGDGYESEENYRKRIFQALDKSAEQLFQTVGIRPRVMVWPYGDYNAVTLEAAKRAGMPLTMGLGDGGNTLADLGAIKRLIVTDDPDIPQFARLMREQRLDQTLRVAQVDMDYLYDDDEEQAERNISALADRIEASGVNTVFLQAYADPDGDGGGDQLYFPNRRLPVRRDLFNRVALRLRSQAKVKVYAWLPIMAYRASLPAEWYVHEWKDDEVRPAPKSRLSPFNPQARQFIGDIYEDLAVHCDFDGILFHDDGILSDFEDASAPALTFGHDVWGLPTDFETLRADAGLRMTWARHKTELLAQFTDYLTDRVKYYRPYIKTARNLFALPVINQSSEEWYAQSLATFLTHYDYAAVEAMPFMEQAENPQAWLQNLLNKVAAHPLGLQKTLFELQTVDWNQQQPVPMAVFIEQVRLLEKNGARHIGYYPDNVHADHPNRQALENLFKPN
ncbi:poly-beta-1,6-N-acetyl-D-glucosamine N-deacetylase PgaB [Methylomonas rivi]|uniref:Poly-beta-1,6-N-acetyl-D-glucosamine N-deacetylase PgaB n=1 Tax=Methylomonas rivi TaxID=2952226 RepID=A0ABT1TZE7_9GAMM|nr:poly-beta-1,6-N-acetyl-D-glucosamine N-deacetylase PgaB [Methylomonas sp. WSC-6]MCQ8126944.1 poly-beta-1,6-N-acetyl-D-glucosamine N-deacetylase PgaB [Methylomonas sp. WSC-6]